jgi:hypothetical protein
MKRALVIATVLCVGASTSLAKPSTTVFPLSAPNLPMKIASAPEQLSKALADELGGAVAPLPIDSAAGLVGCDPEATTCLEAVSKSYKSKRIVFGAISMIDEGRIKVSLTRFDPGPDRQQRTFTLEGDVDEMTEQLIKLSRPLFDGSAPGTEPDEPLDPEDPNNKTKTKKPKPEIPDQKPPEVKGEIGGTTMVILVGGGATTAVGLGFLYWSHLTRNEVDAIQPKNDADFRKLVLLENQGSQRQMIGGILTGIGVVGLGYGIIRAVQDRHSKPASDTGGEASTSLGRRLTPVPIEGGAALVFSMELQ